MSSIMNDLGKDPGRPVARFSAKFLRQSFPRRWRSWRWCSQKDWKPRDLVSLTVPSLRPGARPFEPGAAKSANHASAQEPTCGRTQSGDSGDAQRLRSGGEVLSARRRSNPIVFVDRARQACAAAICDTCGATGDRVAADRILRRDHYRRACCLTRAPQHWPRRADRGRVRYVCHRSADALRTCEAPRWHPQYFPARRWAHRKKFSNISTAISKITENGLAPRNSAKFEKIRSLSKTSDSTIPARRIGRCSIQIRLDVRDGRSISCWVGPSGAGKTTLANLVPRFYRCRTWRRFASTGMIFGDLRLDSLRDKIRHRRAGHFSCLTIRWQIISRYPRRARLPTQIREASRNALAEEFIERMPDGFDTMIGERGQKLSGGQRQRLAIARALLKNAPDSDSGRGDLASDTESEMLVQKALQNLMAHRTVIVIAHRLSTVRRADKIVVLDRGRICEIGRHEELVNRGGMYQRLHEMHRF